MQTRKTGRTFLSDGNDLRGEDKKPWFLVSEFLAFYPAPEVSLPRPLAASYLFHAGLKYVLTAV